MWFVHRSPRLLSQNSGLLCNIQGYSDGPAKNATLTATHIETVTIHVVNSNEEGDFQFVSLEPGKYTLKVSHQEYSELAGIDFWVTRENLTRLTTTYIVCSKKRRTRRDRLPVRNPTRTRARFRPGSFRSTLHVPSIPHTSTTAGMMGHSGSA